MAIVQTRILRDQKVKSNVGVSSLVSSNGPIWSPHKDQSLVQSFFINDLPEYIRSSVRFFAV